MNQAQSENEAIRLCFFGFGPIAHGVTRIINAPHFASSREQTKRDSLENMGLKAFDPTDVLAFREALDNSDALVISAQPSHRGCPAILMLKTLDLPRPKQLIYLSTTGVYGDANGRWVDETTPPAPSSPEGQNRLLAETQVLDTFKSAVIFRLPGLYGLERNAFERMRSGKARLFNMPHHVFSRLHHDDAASAIKLVLEQSASGIFNLCDDAPCPQEDVLIFAAKLMGAKLPPFTTLDDPNVSAMTRRFYADNKRVSNARAKQVLGWRPTYPSYREGLKALFDIELKS